MLGTSSVDFSGTLEGAGSEAGQLELVLALTYLMPAVPQLWSL